MSSYQTLGFRNGVGQPDNTGNNPGNWTVTFAPQDLNVYLPYFEIYKIVIHGAAGSTFDVYVDIAQWDTSVRGDINSWDPVQPLVMSPGQYLYFYWSYSTINTSPPEATIWLRFDTENSQNHRALLNR